MNKHVHRAALWSLLALLSMGAFSCSRGWTVGTSVVDPSTVTPSGVAAAEATLDRTVVVNQGGTLQAVVTSTPAAIQEGGFITRTTFVDAKSANPILGDDAASRALWGLMFEGLLRVDPFTGVLQPNFAEGWTVSQDGLTYTFAIRRGLAWSDGVPITAMDFAFTFAALKSGKLETRHAREVAKVEAIAIQNDYEVEVTFAEADCANLESLQLGWVPAHVFTEDPASFDYAEMAVHRFNGMPTVFSGPFGLQEWVRGDHWTQVRNERYWRGAPHLEGIVTKVVSGQAAMVDMLRQGEADIAVGFEPQYLKELELAPDVQIFKLLSDEYDFLGFQLGDPADPQPRLNPDGTLNEAHGSHPILVDERVRQAIAYALDRGALIAQGRLGQGVPLHANVLPTISWAYNTDLEGRDHDLARANEWLDEAGWQRDEGNGVRQKGGRPLQLTLYTNAGNVVRETMGALIQAQLAEVGIEVTLVAVDWDTFMEVLLGQTFDMVLSSWSNLGSNPDDAHLWRAEDDVPGHGANFVSYYRPELERKLAQAKAAPACDLDQRTRLYRQIQAQLYADQPYCWIDVPRNLVAIQKRVGGTNPGPWNVWYNVHEWHIIG